MPTFDIFSGDIDRDAVWICSVVGLAPAKIRMEELAAEKPGKYFVFFSLDHLIMAQTDTLPQSGLSQKAAS